jgi:hypothetical protein
VRSQKLDQLVLSLVCVLKFVYQNELEALLVGTQPIRMLPKQREGMEQQIIEVHRIGPLQSGAESREHFRRHLGQPIEWRG